MAYTPTPPDKYKGNQVILNSDRLLLNAKTDAIFLTGKQAISFSSAGTLNFDSDNKCVVNSPKIYLGLKATEPLLLGNKTVTMLKSLLDKLGNVADALSNVQITLNDGSTYPLTDVNTPGRDLKLTIEDIKVNISGILSKQNFTL